MYKLKTESSFDAAHFLTDYHGKCENLHGHRWRVVAYLSQEELCKSGTHKDMVLDFGEFKKALRSLTEELDHSFIVEKGSLDKKLFDLLNKQFVLRVVEFRTTAENFSKYIFEEMSKKYSVKEVCVYETPNNCARYVCE